MPVILTKEDTDALLNDAIQYEPTMFMFQNENGTYVSPETDELRVRAVRYFMEESNDLEYDLNVIALNIVKHVPLSELSPRVQNILRAVF